MNVKVTLLKDFCESDLEIYCDLLDVICIDGHTIEFEKKIGVWNEETFKSEILQQIDTPCDLHILVIVYQPIERYSREWFKNAKDVVFYVSGDHHHLGIEGINIQPVISREQPDVSIQAPYVVRPYYIDQLIKCPPFPTEKTVDVLWCGSEVYQMTTRTTKTRKDWLDEFQSLLPGWVNFSRNLKNYEMHEYADMIRRSKITLHIHGLAEHCFRLWEVMHTGGTVVGQRFVNEKPWRETEGVVPDFDTPQEAVDIVVRILREGSWNEIGVRQRAWYAEHYGPESRMQWAKETWDCIQVLTQ